MKPHPYPEDAKIRQPKVTLNHDIRRRLNRNVFAATSFQINKKKTRKMPNNFKDAWKILGVLDILHLKNPFIKIKIKLSGGPFLKGNCYLAT